MKTAFVIMESSQVTIYGCNQWKLKLSVWTYAVCNPWRELLQALYTNPNQP